MFWKSKDLWQIACRGKHTKQQLVELRDKAHAGKGAKKKPAARLASASSDSEHRVLSDSDETGDLLSLSS